MDIFIIRDGRQTGPFSTEAVKAQLTEGSARPTDMGWRKGMAEWRPLSEVLKVASDQAADAATSSPADGHFPNGAPEKRGTATAKQKAFLKYLGAEFDEGIARERAALAISDALENPKLQPRIRKWQDEKLRMHADVFQDEIDYRRANRSNRYLERIQTEGAEVLKDVTKAHVQVLVESLDKRHPGWETERESALWDYLIPAVGEHFPQLVLPDYKNRLKPGRGGAVKGSALTRSTLAAAGVTVMPPARSSTLGAMLRGVLLGVITLGAIVVGHNYWQQSHNKGAAPAAGTPGPVAPAKSEVASALPSLAPKEPAAQPPEKLIVAAKAPDVVPENPPAPAPAPAPVAPNEPAATPAPPVPAEKSAVPMAEKPATPEEKPAVPAPAAPPTAPAPTEPSAATPPPAAPAAPAAPRTVVKLIQGIGVMLQNGQVTLPAGTPLRYLGTEGQNIRVSWNNNVFFVPAVATDVNEPQPVPAAPAAPSATPPAPGDSAPAPAAPGTPAAPKPKKPSDDL